MNFLFPDRWAALAAQYPERTMGRITLREKGGYRIRTSMGEQNALVSGKFQFDAQSPSDYPAVGDYVMVSYADPDTAVIHQVLPRRSLFVRSAAGTSKMEQVVAANIWRIEFVVWTDDLCQCVNSKILFVVQNEICQKQVALVRFNIFSG